MWSVHLPYWPHANLCPSDERDIGRGFNSLAPRRVEWQFRRVIFKLSSVINVWGISCEMTPRRMSLDLTNDKSTLVQVMAWCRQVICRHITSLGHNELTCNKICRFKFKFTRNIKIHIYILKMCALWNSKKEIMCQNDILNSIWPG